MKRNSKPKASESGSGTFPRFSADFATQNEKEHRFDVLKRASIRLYDLRHTTATLLLQAGINPKIVSERLGHSTIVLTLDVYSHVLPNMQRDATNQLEQILFRKTAQFND